MGLFSRIKGLFSKGGDALVAMVKTETYDSILDHPKIKFDASELKRIEQSFMHYRGQYPQVEYLNVQREAVKRDYFFINMTKVVSKYLTTLTFNERCKINIGTLNEDTSEYPQSQEADFVAEILDRTSFKKNLSSYLEPMFATGGLVIRPYYDAGEKEINFSYCLADAFIPLRNNTNNIAEGCIPTLTTVTEGDKKVHYMLLEFHEWEDDLYIISNELYRSEVVGKLGKRVSLTALDVYKDLEPMTTISGLSRPLFSYFKPAGFNNINPRSPLGIGILDNSRSTVKAINDTYDEFRWEVKDGKQRTIISDHFIKAKYDSTGRPTQYFDADTSAFVALPGDMDDMTYKDITKHIRTTEYTEALDKFKSTLEMEVGLSPNTFSITNSGGIKTATEVVSEDSETYKTRNEHVSSIRDSIIDLIISTFELAKFVKVEGKPLYTGQIPERDEIGIDFDDGVFNDKSAELNFIGKARVNRLMPQVEAIMRLNGLPRATAQEWADRINKELEEQSYDRRQAYSESTLLGDEE